MAQIEAVLVIDAPVEAVWKFVSDSANAPQWNPGVLELKQASDGPLDVGTTFRSRWSTRPFRAESRIVEFETNRKITAEVTSPPMMRGTRERLVLRDLGGKTELNSMWDLKLNGLYRLALPFRVGVVRRFNEARVGNAKRILESGNRQKA